MSVRERVFLMFAAGRVLIDTGPITSTMEALGNIGVVIAVFFVSQPIFKDALKEQ